MKITLATTLGIGALVVSVAGYGADYSSKDQMSKDKPSATSTVKENVGDAMITAKVKTEFAKDKEVSAMAINVDTDNKGVVTLKGKVKSKTEADKAVSIARNVQGVTSVKSELQVQ
jgi:osmotically-inducible protein OsmY